MAKALAALVLLLTAHTAFAQGGDWDDHRVRRSNGSARILVLKDYHLESGATARGPIVVVGGTAIIDGHAEDDVVVLAGRLRVGPKAVIDGDVVTLAGSAQIDPQATVYGDVDETVMHWPDDDAIPRRFLAGLALGATMLRLMLVFAVALILTLVAPGWVRRIATRVGAGAVSSAAIGVACEVAFLPVVLVCVIALTISIVGIPLIGLMPFVMLAAAVAGTAGFAAVAARIGARLRGTTTEMSTSLAFDVFLGTIAVSAMTVVATVLAFGSWWAMPVTWSMGALGLGIEYLVWTIGIGAACASALRRWDSHAPSPGLPPSMPAAPTVI